MKASERKAWAKQWVEDRAGRSLTEKDKAKIFDLLVEYLLFLPESYRAEQERICRRLKNDIRSRGKNGAIQDLEELKRLGILETAAREDLENELSYLVCLALRLPSDEDR